MARIPESEIERLKSEISLERLVTSAGIELKKAGKQWQGHCPYHEDDTPSLFVSPDKNLWNCLGCQAGGDVFAWVMKMKGVSFRHAYEILNTDPSLAAAARPVKQGTVSAPGVDRHYGLRGCVAQAPCLHSLTEQARRLRYENQSCWSRIR